MTDTNMIAVSMYSLVYINYKNERFYIPDKYPSDVINAGFRIFGTNWLQNCVLFRSTRKSQ